MRNTVSFNFQPTHKVGLPHAQICTSDTPIDPGAPFSFFVPSSPIPLSILDIYICFEIKIHSQGHRPPSELSYRKVVYF